MNYEDYKFARDKAWRVLLEGEVAALPVQVSALCTRYGFLLRSYERGAEWVKAMGLEEQFNLCDGFTVYRGGTYYILYNDRLSSAGRIRFTIAHELGHIFLCHLALDQFSLRNREPEPEDDPAEQAANVFASRLLAPACVLHALGAVTPERIAELCDISLKAAQFRAGRMGVLEQRGRFGASPLERQVLAQFAGFIARSHGAF